MSGLPGPLVLPTSDDASGHAALGAGFPPAGTPNDVVERLTSLGADAAGGTPAQFAKVIRDEHESWKAVIQRAGIKAE